MTIKLNASQKLINMMQQQMAFHSYDTETVYSYSVWHFHWNTHNSSAVTAHITTMYENHGKHDNANECSHWNPHEHTVMKKSTVTTRLRRKTAAAINKSNWTCANTFVLSSLNCLLIFFNFFDQIQTNEHHHHHHHHHRQQS